MRTLIPSSDDELNEDFFAAWFDLWSTLQDDLDPADAYAAIARSDPMLIWGAVIFAGLWLVLRDVNPVTKAKLMGNPLFIDVIVIGSGLWIHGGSADGAMAAIVSGVCSALYVRWQRRMHGFIRRNQWHPGVLCARDPRSTS